jgi:nucleoside-diphosphate-sugar epimerase
MIITITGASGFIGKNFQTYLKSTNEVESLSVRYIPNQQLQINADAIIHLAGKAHDLKKVSHPKDYYEANFELTKQLFDAFLISEATVFIFMSTVKAVADEVKGILTEETIPNPKTHYGIAKQKAEDYILSQKVPDDKRVYILRPCMIHGPENKGNLNLLYQLVAKGLPWPLGAFENQRSFLSIENLCFVINQILEREDIPSGVYNLADDETLSTNELIELIATTTNRKARIFPIPNKLINKIAKIGDVLHLPLNTERLDKLTENFVVSNLKIKVALGIEKLPVTAKDGLVKTIQSFTK